ncbi:MAG: family 43 glycosylhydrolase [Bacteroidales bacterium]|nr:family 43 glycosylhydrolase [Bacteroidales bacterium]
MVYDGKVFLYTTHDEDWGANFEMYDWLLYTSEDMVNWTDHGAVASTKDFAWRSRDNGAWALQVVARNGKFYMYCPLHGHGIGVLVADSPYGPFKDPLGEPLVWQREHWEDIDPTVFIDDDGQAYMYWGNPNVYWAKLNEDMISLGSEVHKLDYKIQDYQEGPWFYKRNGHYYLAFASTCCPEGIGYAMSDTPEGPWEYKGHIMNHTPRTRGNHPGIIDYKGKSYVFGLNYDLMHLDTFAHHERRSVSAAEMHYNPDGTIQEVPYFFDADLDQIAPFKLNGRIEAETMAWGYGLKTSKIAGRGIVVDHIDQGEYLQIKGADFGKGKGQFSANVFCDNTPATIEIHLDSVNGPLEGTLQIAPGKDWKTVSCKLNGTAGVHDIFFVFKGKQGHDLFEWDWWQMK